MQVRPQTGAAEGEKYFIIFYPPGLLLHLCIFHVYINITGLTTYEYVRAQRISPEPSQRESISEDQSQLARLSPSPSEPEQSKCECRIKTEPSGRAKSNKVGPSSSEEVGSGFSQSESEINVLSWFRVNFSDINDISEK